MEQRECGHSGLTLSVLGLGCWSFGGGEYWGPVEQSDVDTVVRRAFELGITYFDTAEATTTDGARPHSGGRCADCHVSRSVIGTKVSPAHVQPDVLPGRCEASLRGWARTTSTSTWCTGRSRCTRYVILMCRSRSALRWTTPSRRCCGSRSRARCATSVSATSRVPVGGGFGLLSHLAVNELPYNLLSRAIEWEALPASRELGLACIGMVCRVCSPISTDLRRHPDVAASHTTLRREKERQRASRAVR